MQNVNMVLKNHAVRPKTIHIIKMAKSERHPYNRQLQDYCNDLCDKKMKTTKMRGKHHRAENITAESLKH